MPVTPAEFMDEVALPTAREFMAERGDRRRAYLACIAAFHLCDYVSRADGVKLDVVRPTIRSLCQPSFDVVEGVCNGSKHCGRTRGTFRHEPGGERDVPAFAFDTPGAGWGEGRWKEPGLMVQLDGQGLFVDACLQAFLVSAAKAYPAHFGSCDPTSIDATLRWVPAAGAEPP